MSETAEPPAIPPGTYEHYKGHRYEVLTLARHSETEEWLVVYRQLYGDHGVWVRPADMFAEHVEVDGGLVPRFRRVESSGADAAAGPPADVPASRRIRGLPDRREASAR
ncbi:DUF1653 domain-containing protein [Agromyces sp. GXQ0307]|uniref:DUF1653 domain-containing protein n=1 Tax=Agromyces sp. GXQ0307 TaxID=3377835 RepID=UPI00383A7E2E